MEYDKEKVYEVVTALQRSRSILVENSASKQKKVVKVALLPEKESVSLTIVQKRYPRQQFRVFECTLPHPFKTMDSTEVCLIIKDISTEKDFDHERGIDRYKEFLKNCGVQGIAEVITFKQLRSEYKPYEAKRRLLNHYDMFLVDERLYGKLAEVLGKKFFIKNKFPHPVSLADPSGLANKVRIAIEAAYLTIKGTGVQCSVEVARADQKPQEIASNINAVVSFIRSHLPGGWDNIRTLYVKYKQFSLPIFVDTESPNNVSVEKPHSTTGFFSPAESVTTVKEGKVKILRDGTTKVLKPRKRSKKMKNLKM